MTTETRQIETPKEGQPLRSAQEAFQNHEERMQTLESFANVLGEAFPHLRDALGLPRHPHQFTKDEMSGAVFDPNRATIDALMQKNEHLEAMLTQILGRLPQLPGVTEPDDAPPAAPAW